MFTRVDFSEGSGVVVEDEVLEHPVPRVGLEELELDVDLLLFLPFRNLVLFFLYFNFNFSYKLDKLNKFDKFDKSYVVVLLEYQRLTVEVKIDM